jgi:hypothetical protein
MTYPEFLDQKRIIDRPSGFSAVPKLNDRLFGFQNDVVAIKMGRRFVGVELKSSYYQQAKLNLIAAESATERDLFKEAV